MNRNQASASTTAPSQATACTSTESKNPVVRKVETFITQARTGKVIKQKLGSNLLWRKEFHEKYGYFMLDIRQFICQNCGHHNKLAEQIRRYVSFGEMSIHNLVCERCRVGTEFKYKNESVNPDTEITDIVSELSEGKPE